MKDFKENWLVHPKMRWGICKISPGHSTASDLGLWCETFSQSRKCMKVYRGVTYHEKEKW